MPNKITSWSFSRYSDYKLCPAKAKYKHVLKLKEPGNEAMERGNQIHKFAELYIKGDLARLPAELKSFEAEFKTLRKQHKKKLSGMVVEETWAFTKEWTRTEWNDWVGCWVRIKLDCAHHEDETTLVVTDWKTGKFRPEMNDEYVEQLELYALAALLLHPHLTRVKPRLAYTDQGVVYPDTADQRVFIRADIPKLTKLWASRTKAMLSDTRFAPRPNDKCRWCHFRAANGGPCKY